MSLSQLNLHQYYAKTGIYPNSRNSLELMQSAYGTVQLCTYYDLHCLVPKADVKTYIKIKDLGHCCRAPRVLGFSSFCDINCQSL